MKSKFALTPRYSFFLVLSLLIGLNFTAATEKNFTNFSTKINPSAFTPSVLLNQTFNGENPADFESGIWRIPEGWEAQDATGDFPEGTHTFPFTAAGSPTGKFTTTHLGLKDYQLGSPTYIERNIPTSNEGTLGLWYYFYINPGYSFESNLILRTSTGVELLTLKGITESTGEDWTLQLNGVNTELLFESKALIHVAIAFDNGEADLFINSEIVLEGISYTSGAISNVKIDTGGLDSSGQGHYDDFVLYGEKLTEIPYSPIGEEGSPAPNALNLEVPWILGIVVIIGTAAIVLVIRKTNIARKQNSKSFHTEYNPVTPVEGVMGAGNQIDCPNCGHRLQGGEVFCSECGFRILFLPSNY